MQKVARHNWIIVACQVVIKSVFRTNTSTAFLDSIPFNDLDICGRGSAFKAAPFSLLTLHGVQSLLSKTWDLAYISEKNVFYSDLKIFVSLPPREE